LYINVQDDPFYCINIIKAIVEVSGILKNSGKYSLIISIVILLILTSIPVVSAQGIIELILSDSLNTLPGDLEQIGEITSLTFDLDGSIYFIENNGKRLIHADINGKYLTQTGGFGFGDESYRKPADITLVGFEVWVPDPIGRRIVRFDRRLVPLGPLSRTLGHDVQLPFNRPISVAQAATGEIVVIEADRQEALRMNSSGRLLNTFGGYGETDKILVSPQRIEISRDGKIAISDNGSKAIHFYDKFGSERFVLALDREPAGLAWYKNYIFVSTETGVLLFSEKGALVGKWPNEKFGGKVNDLAVYRNRLAVAAGNTIYIYRIVQGTD
jgi:hypothetical protein